MFAQQLKKNSATMRMSIQKKAQSPQVFGRRRVTQPQKPVQKQIPKGTIKVVTAKEQIVGLDPEQYTQKYFLCLYQTLEDPLVPGQLWRHTFSPQYPHQVNATISVRPQSFVLSSVNSSNLPQVVWVNMTGIPGFMNNQSNFSGAIAGFVLSEINSTQFQGILVYNATYRCDDEATWDIAVSSTSSLTVTYDDDPTPITQLFNPTYLRIFIKNRQLN